MSSLTAKSYIRSNSLELIPNDKESLENQLDRLNKVIQNITSSQFSPEMPLMTISPSQESFEDFSKSSFYEGDDSKYDEQSEIPDSLNNERLMMTIEDFRSHEDRGKYLIKGPPMNSKIVLDVSYAELAKLNADINNIRISCEDSVVENIVNVCGKQIIFRMRDREKVFVNKNILCNSFAAAHMNKNPMKNALKKAEVFQTELENLMQQSYNDSFAYSTNKIVNHNLSYKYNTTALSQTEISIAKAQKIEHLKLVEKLQWQCSEIAMIKENYKKKLQKMHEHEKFIRQKRNEIHQEESKVYSQRIIIGKDLELIQEQKKAIEQIKEDNRKKLEIVKNTLAEMQKNANFIIKPACVIKQENNKNKSEECIKLKPRKNEHKYDIDGELQSISKEIKELEALLVAVPQNAEHIQIRLDRLKTKESNLKSNRVITASLERSSSMSSKLNFIDKDRTKTPLSTSKSKPILESKILKSSNNSNISLTNSVKKPPFISPIKTIEKTIEKHDDYQKYLKLRESRLIEKEQDLSKRENMLLNLFNQNSDSISLVTIVQSEQRNMKIIKNDLEKRQKVLEQEVLNCSRKSSELKAKERDILNAIESFDAFTYQKKHIENRLQFLLSIFEDISKPVLSQNNI
ncbi:hypothetical protein SteCoe_3975 [Stentor coeruleus]|uniref:Uncharacterized protein n=1 Tax=Stentor coeruleus TaxID=5963 RepID=A0A1R2CVW7_9CILI|nr:hypothetical protein SteCoe_3975 [Stentor coeruleus]